MIRRTAKVCIHVHINSALISCNCLAVDSHVHAAVNCNSTVICADTIVLADSFAINTIAIFLNCCNVAVNSQFRALFSIQAIRCTICTINSAFNICIDIQGCAASCYGKGCISISTGFVSCNQQLACGNIAGNIRLFIGIGINCSLVSLQRQRIFAGIYCYTLKGFFEGCYPIRRNFCYAKDGILIAYGNRTVLRKGIFLVAGSNTCVDIFSVSCSKALDLGCELSLYRNFSFYVAALTGFIIKGNVAGIVGLSKGRSCQSIGNAYCTCQISFIINIGIVVQLTRQGIQHVCYAVFTIQIDTSVIGNQGYCSILCRMLDNSVASCVVVSCFTVTGVCIEDIGITAVVINGQRSSIILDNVAGMCCITAAGKVGYMAAHERSLVFIIFKELQFSIKRIGPGCTILQPQVVFTGKVLAYSSALVSFSINTGSAILTVKAVNYCTLQR